MSSVTDSGRLLSLDAIEPGHCGIVREVEAGESEVDLLKSLGVCLGRKVMLVQAGDPLVLKVLGSRLGVSARLAARVRVEPCAGDAFGERRLPRGIG